MSDFPQISPPKNFTKFLKWFCKTEYYEDIQGDLEEDFQLLYQECGSLNRAQNWYRLQIIRLFRPSMTKGSKIQKLIDRLSTMFKNNLKIGFRSLWKYKTGSIINITGLAIGMAAFILIALFTKDEISYDRHFEHVDDIYRVTVKNFTQDGTLSRHWAFASAGHAERLKADYQTITHAARFFPWGFPDIEYGDLSLRSQPVIFCDKDAFEIFKFPFIIGSPENAFDDIFSIVLTEESAIRIFGNDWREQDILGQALKLSRDGNEGPFKVTGVIEDMPEQQHFHFEYLAPIKFLEMVFGKDEMNNVGGNYNWMTYVRLQPGADIQELEASSDEFFEKYMDPIFGRPASEFREFEYQRLKDIHLYSNLEGEYEANGSIDQIYVFGVVGVLLLLVACVNYMNLATSHYTRRMKEVGVRKVVGATRSTLLYQFLTESFLITMLAIPVMMVLIYYGLPFINTFMEKNLVFNPFDSVELIGAVVLLVFTVGLLAGLYPAIFLSKIDLHKSLKGESAMRASKWNFRSWLITFQYSVAIALIFSIVVIEGQLSYIQGSNPGFRKDQILNTFLSDRIQNIDVFKDELLKIPNVKNVTYSSRIPTGRLMDNAGSQFYKGDSLVPASFRLPVVSTDERFIDTYEIELIAGENFTKSQDAYVDSIGYYIINRRAAEAMGYQNPEEIIGAKLSYGMFDGDGFKMGKIQGVVEDFHFESMHAPIVPMVMIKTNNNVRELSVKLNEENVSSTVAKIEAMYRDFDPGANPNFRFVDDLFDEQYQNEERLGTMIRVFTTLAVFIGCLGLIGMVGFIIETKTKEIGIRKVLGASNQSILMIISSQFFTLIGIAFLFALPVSYWFMQSWLDGFVYRTNITVFNIFLPLVITALFTTLTLGYQSLKAMNSNPVESLKDE